MAGPVPKHLAPVLANFSNVDPSWAQGIPNAVSGRIVLQELR